MAVVFVVDVNVVIVIVIVVADDMFYYVLLTIQEAKTRLKSRVFSLEILILLIYTNIPRTNVAWTNAVVTVVICCICSPDPLFKIWSKSGQ